MPDAMLEAKVRIPAVRPALVSRPRLAARLEAGVRGKLTLVSAPAGFGKTTLLSAWARDRDEPNAPAIAWLSLDAGDNDPARFLAGWLAALCVEARPQPWGTAEGIALAAALSGAVQAPAPPSRHTVLVLDDFHAIEAREIHAAVAQALERLPPCLHLVIVTRADPPLPLARLRARGELVEIRARDLRFAEDETAAFLEQTMGLALAAGDAAALGARTEGWVAGLQLAALSLQGRRDVAEFVREFTGSHRYVLDYLTEEVLLHQPEDVQRFLRETSILTRLSGPLCAAVTGRADSQALLECLERGNLFLVPLDDERNWYRYHHLFGDLLRNRLARVARDRLPDLHVRAADWYEAAGLLGEAFPHALAAGDASRAANLAERHGGLLMQAGEITTLLNWWEALPAEARRAHPRLGLIAAWGLYLSGRLGAVEAVLQAVEAAAREHPKIAAGLLAEAAVVRAFVVCQQGDYAGALALTRAALAGDSGDYPVLLGLLSVNLGNALQEVGDLDGAIAAFTDAAPRCQAAGIHVAAASAHFNTIRVQVLRGRLRDAAAHARRLLQERAHEARPAAATGLFDIALATVLYEWNELGAAEERVCAGLALGEAGGYPELVRNGYWLRARLCRARGDAAGAWAAFERVAEVSRTAAWPCLDAYRAWLAFGLGEHAAALAWARASDLGVDGAPEFAREAEQVIYARVLLAAGDRAELPSVAVFLERLSAAAEVGGRGARMVELLVLRALAHDALGERAAAVTVLARALALAEPESYVRTFLDEGMAVAGLLAALGVDALRACPRAVPGVPRLVAYRDRLIEAFGDSPVFDTQRSTRNAERTGPEALTARERDILRLIAAGLSTREIAEELYLSINTVKTHTKNLYAKLGVRNRAQAVSKAGQ